MVILEGANTTSTESQSEQKRACHGGGGGGGGRTHPWMSLLTTTDIYVGF
jgi:hypothetical protein